jgi:hypothetical protein
MDTTSETFGGIASVGSVVFVSPHEIGEDILLSEDDNIVDVEVSYFDSMPRSEGRICKDEVRPLSNINATIGVGVQSCSSKVGHVQEYSFALLVSACFTYCQDVLLFGTAIGSLYFCHNLRGLQVRRGTADGRRCTSSQNEGESVPSHETESALDVAALVKAMYSENKDELKKMFDERSIDACDAWCCTALHIAANYKCREVAEALLDRGADADVKDAWDETPLHFAARVGDSEMCALLIRRGAQINAANAAEWTPLLVAAKAGMVHTCEFLLDHAGHAGGVDEEDLPPLLSCLLLRRIASAT